MKTVLIDFTEKPFNKAASFYTYYISSYLTSPLSTTLKENQHYLFPSANRLYKKEAQSLTSLKPLFRVNCYFSIGILGSPPHS